MNQILILHIMYSNIIMHVRPSAWIIACSLNRISLARSFVLMNKTRSEIGGGGQNLKHILLPFRNTGS